METDPISRRRERMLSLASILLIAIVLGVGVWVILRPFADILVAAAMLTVSFYPAYGWIHSRVRSADLSALLCVLALLLLILVPLFGLGSVVLREARSAYGGLQQESQRKGGWPEYISSLLDAPAALISSKTGIPKDGIRTTVSERASAAAGQLVQWSGRLFGNLTATLTDIVLTLFVMFFFFPMGERLIERLPNYVPIERRRLDTMLATMKAAIVANIYGVVAVAAVQGALVGIGFALAGIRSPVMWAVVAAFASLIPLVGTALIIVPAAAFLALSGLYGQAVFIAIWGAVVVGMSDNFVRPLVLRTGIQMNTLAIFLALMGGIQAFGFVGLFAGPVILTMASVTLRILHEERLSWQESAATRPASIEPPEYEI